MSGWEVGDLARLVLPGVIECGVGCHSGEGCPPEGAVRRVVFVTTTGAKHGSPCKCMHLEFDDGSGALAKRCVKIKPDTEPCEEEFTVLIKRGRKVSV
jgi:hypothetical protein